MCEYTLCLKNIPDILDSNVNKNYQILIIFGVNIPHTTCHQMIVQFYLARCFLLHHLGKEKRAKYALKYTKKSVKNIPNINDRDLIHDYQISMIFGQIFLTQLAIKLLFKFPPHLMSVSAPPGEKSSKIRVEMNEKKTSINFV